jgi:GNAT superfamily N-acetyltransferase
MNQVTVRVATPNDLIGLADMWCENRVIQQQSDARVTLLPGAKARWIAEAAAWLNDVRCSIWVANRGAALSGYLIAWLQDMPPGVQPNRVGCITDMAVDPHVPSAGATQHLLNAARAWFKEQGIENLIATVPHRQPVQQAFWRGQGARTWMDLMWLKL